MVLSFLTASAEPEPITWTSLFEKLQQLVSIPWLWVVLSLVAVAFWFLLDVGDKLSGILGWLGIDSPFQRSQLSTEQLEKTRRKLLKIIQKDVDRRLATSLHQLIKLDLYMEDQLQCVGKSKLALVPEDPLDIEDTGFLSVNRVLRQPGTNKPSLNLKFTQKIIEIFQRPDIQGKLLILGEPGSGKTTELLYLAKDLAIRAYKDEQQPVPIILELSSWNGKTISNWVANQLNRLYNISEATTQQWLADHQILLLLDGLDELGLQEQRHCIEAINHFLVVTYTPELVVCCRVEEYEECQVKLDRLNGAIYLEALEKNQIYQYFSRLNRLNIWNTIANNATLLALAQKPLFLFMLVVAYQGNIIRNEQDLFDNYIHKQLRETKNKNTYKISKAPTEKQTQRYLVWLAIQLENARETEFLIEGLQRNSLSSSEQRSHYVLSFGCFLGLVGMLIFSLFFGLFFGLNTVIVSAFFGACLGLLTGILIGSEQDFIQPKGKLRWSYRQGITVGFSIGLLFFFVGIEAELGISFGLVFGLFFGMIVGLFGGLRGISIEEKEIPNQAIKQGVQNVFIVVLASTTMNTFIFGLLYFMFSGPSYFIFFGSLFGVLLGLTSSLIVGLESIAQHLILRILLTRNGYIPWNYERFLEHAAKHRFIQRTGGRYRFIHDLLRKHFAQMPLD